MDIIILTLQQTFLLHIKVRLSAAKVVNDQMKDALYWKLKEVVACD